MSDDQKTTAGIWFPDIRPDHPCAMTQQPIPAVCPRCGSTCVDPCHDLVAQLDAGVGLGGCFGAKAIKAEVQNAE